MTHSGSSLSIGARSWLFAPGDSDRKIEKAAGSAADAVIFDLEDAVAISEKDTARQRVADFLTSYDGDRSRLWVRINPLDTPYALPDLAAVVPGRPAGIVLPKPRGREDALILHHYIAALEASAGIDSGSILTVVLATEVPASMLNIGSYAGVPRLAGMSWGAEDLATALGAATNKGDCGAYDGYDFTYELGRSLCLVGAAAAGVDAIETIHGDFRDLDGLKARAERVCAQGFRGMLAIHPAQVDIINAAFTPSEEDIAAAQKIVDAFAANPGAGTIGLDGEMIDRPHLDRANALLRAAKRKDA